MHMKNLPFWVFKVLSRKRNRRNLNVEKWLKKSVRHCVSVFLLHGTFLLIF